MDHSIPFLDLKSQYESISNEIDDAIKKVIKGGSFIGGEIVESFENASPTKAIDLSRV